MKKSSPRRNQRRTKAQEPKAPQAAPGVDGAVLVVAGLLILIGVVMSYSTTAALSLERRLPPLFLAHLMALCLGIAGAAMGMLLPPSFWRRVSLPLWLLSTGLLIATLLVGIKVNGAQRWLALPIGDLRFQPVALVKFSTLPRIKRSRVSPAT